MTGSHSLIMSRMASIIFFMILIAVSYGHPTTASTTDHSSKIQKVPNSAESDHLKESISADDVRKRFFHSSSDPSGDSGNQHQEFRLKKSSQVRSTRIMSSPHPNPLPYYDHQRYPRRNECREYSSHFQRILPLNQYREKTEVTL